MVETDLATQDQRTDDRTNGCVGWLRPAGSVAHVPTHTELAVTSTEQLNPGMVRVRFTADDLSAFAESRFTDRYVKLQLGTDAEPVMRTYTAIDVDVAAGTLAIDFVVHGDDGFAGPWATAARPGDRIVVRGPGGAFRPDPEADWYLFAGDAAALPAIRAALAALSDDAVGHCIVQVDGPEHEQPLASPEGVHLRWLHGNAGALVDGIAALPWMEGRVQVFVHGEAQVVMHGVRPYLLKERNVARSDASISGYWRRGRAEEGFRTWKSELAAAESV